jgi:hypothetical protein
MSITYDALVTDLKEWAEDDSTEFVASIPDIITRSEDRIHLECPNLISFRTVESGNLSSGTSTYTTTATDILSIRYIRLTVSSAYVFVEQRAESYLEDFTLGTATTGQPQFYAQVSATTSGTTLLFGPTPDSAYTINIKYKRRPTGLSSTTSTTFLSILFPDVLFKAAMYEAAIFLNREDTMKQILLGEFTTEVGKMKQEVQRNLIEEDAV